MANILGNAYSVGTFGLRSNSTEIGDMTTVGLFGWWEEIDAVFIPFETIRLSSSLMTLVSISSGIKISEEFRSNLI